MKTLLMLLLSFSFAALLQSAEEPAAGGNGKSKAEQADPAQKDKQPAEQGAEKAVSTQEKNMPLNRKMKTLDGKEVTLSEQYKDKVVLVVNVASKCGLTPQYKQLEALYKQKKDKGFRIAAFPCNQFGKQEPGTADEIKTFCSTNYGVTFDMYEKIEVNGDGACALYKTLTTIDTKPTGSGKISWNFEKFLIGKDGKVIARFGPRTTPDDAAVVAAIDKALAAD